MAYAPPAGFSTWGTPLRPLGKHPLPFPGMPCWEIGEEVPWPAPGSFKTSMDDLGVDDSGREPNQTTNWSIKNPLILRSPNGEERTFSFAGAREDENGDAFNWVFRSPQGDTLTIVNACWTQSP